MSSISCIFKELWTHAKDAMSQIFNVTTFQDLVDRQKVADSQYDYSI